ncbi:hypothetical protein [Hyphobacterium sp.]|uniref:Abi-alpha family protein n=1 Tax=Hyphobacterium sp. TaxID=2004662 RepID=UPI003BA8F2DB
MEIDEGTKTSAIKSISEGLDKIFGKSGSEVGEYLADKVRFHRWRSLNKLLDKANNYASDHDIRAEFPSLKVLVPIVESATLEDDDDLLEFWARLLVAAGDASSATIANHRQILASISSDEAKLIESTKVFDDGRCFSRPSANYRIENQRHIYISARQYLFQNFDPSTGLSTAIKEAIDKFVQNTNRIEGLKILHFTIGSISPAGSQQYFYSEEYQNSYDSIENLVHLGFYRSAEVQVEHDVPGAKCTVSYVEVTPTGALLLRALGLTKERKPLEEA